MKFALGKVVNLEDNFNNILLDVLNDTKEIEKLHLTEVEFGRLQRVKNFISREVYNYKKELEKKVINLTLNKVELS